MHDFYPTLSNIRARFASNIKENPKLCAVVDELRKGGAQGGGAVSEVLKSMDETESVFSVRIQTDFLNLNDLTCAQPTARVSSTIEKTTEPIRNTVADNNLTKTVTSPLSDAGTSKRAGFEGREL